MNSDERHEDINNSSINTSISHTMELIKAAVPYLDNDSKQSLDFFIKVGDLIETMGTAKSKPGLSALNLDISSIDLEGLLNSVRNVCYEKEREIVDMILNFIKAKNMYQTYTTLTQAMASQTGDSNDSSDTNNPFGNMGNMASMFGNMFGGMPNNGGTPNNGEMPNNGENPSNMNEMLEAFLTPEQLSTYETLSVLLNAM